MGISFTLDKTTVKPGETVKVNWTYKNTWTKSYSFKIEFKINGSSLKTISLGTVYSGQTKTGSFTFTAPKTPGTYTVKAISYLYTYGQWVDEDSYTKTLTVASPEEEKCTKEEFRNSMVSTYRDKAIGWYNSYSPILNVTSTVRQIYPDVTKATLTIYGSNLSAIRVEGPYSYMPPALTTEIIVSNWERGEEWERQYLSLIHI